MNISDTHSNLKVAHLNIWSLLPKINYIRNIILQYDILTLSETWLSSNVSNTSISISNYNLIRKDRDNRGGGVAAYVHKSLNFKLINSNALIEQLWFSLKLKSSTYVFGVIYRSPSLNYKTFIDELEISFTLCTSVSDKIICLGDVNINMLFPSNPPTKYFIEFLKCFNLTQHISEPTRTAQGSVSLIDIILSSDSALVKSSGVEVNHESDHDLVYCIVNVKSVKQTPTIVTYRDFKHLNNEEFEKDLNLLPLQQIYFTDNINHKLRILNNNIVYLFDKHAPFKTVKITKKPAPWLTDTIKLMMKLRDKAKFKFKMSRSVAHWDYYKTLRNLTTASIKREKKAYFTYKLKQCNTKDFWRELSYLNIQKCRDRQIPENLCNPNEINNYFVDSIPTLLADKETENFYLNSSTQNVKFEFSTVTEHEVLSLVNGVKSNAVGSDGINIKMLKLCCPVIIKYITHIINSCITKHVFPDSWKAAIVIPLPKVNEPKTYSDLRPISILPTLSKILEKLMNKQITYYLNSRNLLPETQSGFRQFHSCTTALINITDDILQAYDDGKITVLVLLDYSKAFDTIDRDLLFSILQYIGFSTDAIGLIKSYFDKRLQTIKIDNKISSARQSLRGVPQGSILGPLFYTIYTFNFSRYIEFSKIHMYADDTQIYHSFQLSEFNKSIEELTKDLNKLYQVSTKHALKLNPSKSCVVLVGRNSDCEKIKDAVHITINNAEIAVKDEAKNLGLILDSSFRYKSYINSCIQKAYLNLKLLFPHRAYLDQTQKKILCETLVLSHFTYCCEIYSNCIDYDTSMRIQRVQNSCLRYIYGIRKYDHISSALKNSNWLNMKNRRLLQTASLYHKIILNKKPPYLYNKITFRTDVHNLNLRFRGLITAPQHRTAIFERSFQYNISKIYNNIPSYLKSLSIKSFRKQYSNKLLQLQIGNSVYKV